MSRETPAGARRPARWNIVSLSAPFVGLPVGICAAVALSPTHFPNEGAGLVVWCGFCAFGLLAAGLATARAERLWGLTAAGFFLNVALAVFLIHSLSYVW